MLFRSRSSDGYADYLLIGRCKINCILFWHKFRYSTLLSFHRYFGQPFAECAVELRHLFYDFYPKGESEDPFVQKLYTARSKEPFTSPTYEAFLEIFENLKNGLPDVDPDPIPEPGAWIYEEVTGLPYCTHSESVGADDDSILLSFASGTEKVVGPQLEGTGRSGSVSQYRKTHRSMSSGSKRKSADQDVFAPKRRREGRK